MQTELTKLLGIKHPIIQGGMVHIGISPLSAAISNAGGLGVISAGGMSVERLQQQINLIRELSSKPFGVNIPLLARNADELVKVVLENKVTAVIFSAGNPGKYINDLKRVGTKIMAVVPNVSLAIKMQEFGVDAVVASGFEAGGHVGNDEITTLALIPQVVKKVKVPVIAAGGIANSQGFVAALSLGAQGVQMGTAFAVSKESPANLIYKQAIYNADDKSTTVIGKGYFNFRGLKNQLSKQVKELENQGKKPEEVLQYIGHKRNELGLVEGNLDDGTLGCGQIVGLIDSEKSVQEIIDEIINGAEEIINNLAVMLK